MIKVTVVDDIKKKPAQINTVDIAAVVNNIKYDEVLRKKTDNYRITVDKTNELIKTMTDEKQIKELEDWLKKQKRETFNAVVPGCLFKDNSSREGTNIDYVTGLYSIDFDKLTNLQEALDNINRDEYTLVCYVSPSGNGLKVVVKYNKTYLTDIKEQIKFVKLQLFPHLEEYYRTKYNLIADRQAVDITRNAFICYDENVYFNEGSSVFDLKPNKDIVKYKIDHIKTGTDILDKIYNCLVGQKLTLEKFTEDVYPNVQDVNYYRWIDFGWFLCSLYPHKEETVKNYFHMFSSLDTQLYNKEDCEKKIENLISTFDPNRKNYKLYFHNMMIWSERNIGLVLSVDEKKELKQQPNYIIDYIKENITIKQEEITEEQFITFTHKDKSIACEFKDTKIEGNEVMNTLFAIFNLYFNIHSPQMVKNYLLTNNMRKFNKVQDYLDRIRTYDGTYLQKFLDFVPTSEPQSVREMYMRSWMLGVICNFYRHEDKCNKFLIFKGPQLWGKTTLVKNILLAPFMDLEVVEENFNFSTTNKDDLQKLNTMLFLFDDELSASSKKDIENIKKITSQNSMTYRKPYGIDPKTYYRISSFIGCSNQDQVFNDDTGGGRWWVLELNKIIYPQDYKGIYTKQFMEKCWGYIYDQYCNGERWNEGKYRIDYKLQMELAEKSRVKSTEEEILRDIIVKNRTNKMTLVEITNAIAQQYPDLHLRMINYTNRFGRLLNNMGIKQKRVGKTKTVKYLCRIKLPGDKITNYEDDTYDNIDDGEDIANIFGLKPPKKDI